MRSTISLISSTLLLLLSSQLISAEQSLTDIERASNQSLLWGPYRPNVYFGVRPRIPQSLLMGLMWTRVEDYQSVQTNFRHTCEQNEGFAGYGWDRYDPRHGGIQTIHDAGNQIDITTSFFKDTSAGDKGGNWGVRIKGVPREDAPQDLKSTLFFYVASEGPKGMAGIFNKLEAVGSEEELKNGYDGDVVLEGEQGELGEFRITIKGDAGSDNRHPTHGHPSGMDKSLDKTFVHSASLPEEVLWQSKPLLFSMLKGQIDEYIEKYTQENPPPPFQLYTLKPDAGPGNMQFVQKVFEGAFEFDILFSSKSADKELDSDALTSGINTITKSFDRRFVSVFKPKAPFTSPKYLEFSKSLFSNLLGGIGYFDGDWKVDRSYASEYEEENEGFWEETAEARARAPPQVEGPSQLFTSIPSRPFFPRGFLWDEGFHLMPVIDWDVDLTLQIIKSWFSLIDEDGWIAREQILGEEARSKVPAEFQVQYPHYANPPTLFFILSTFIDKLSAAASTDDTAEYAPQLLNKDSATAYLKEIYPLLKRHYTWFRRTQSGDISSYDRTASSTKEAYRWRGRSLLHCLPSGLDDYPRAQPPHPGELHVDALSWVGLMASSLSKVANYLEEEEDAETFAKQLTAIKSNLADLHWSEKDGIFCDATIDEFEENALVCHTGYISLFPFILNLLDLKTDAGKISKILTALADPEKLWSDHGIRSLSKADPLYGTAENYWRSPVWININYLILTQLLNFAESKDAGKNQKTAARLYKELRGNLVRTVYDSWEETGFAWEQYDPESGRGQRTQHFTGWTSLIVKVMQMPEVAAARGGSEGGFKEEL
ncbi:glycoside hydrolase [Tothia fuscella]|uniref:Mannosyl-oligosaccharide glucosidase n=1 Tax=Tothia fuscella TaxID=1048955 RepID=A0A9P4NM91_9PEZI|nr:glycoside hydrolase [Tothia fuscella]